MLAAESAGTRTSYCDRYPTACEDMPQLEQWRTQGAAPDVTPASFNRASNALKQTPVPPPSKGETSQGTSEAPEVQEQTDGGTAEGTSQDGLVLTSGSGNGQSPSAPLESRTALLAATFGLLSAAGLFALRRHNTPEWAARPAGWRGSR